MNASERARDLAMSWALPDELEDEISAAIRASETEALERAAKLVERWHITKGGYTEMAHQLRSLKEPTP